MALELRARVVNDGKHVGISSIRYNSLSKSPWSSLTQIIVLPMFARDYVADLAERGRHHFTTDEAVGAIGSPRSSVRAQLRRLKVRGVIAKPVRGFNMIVPAKHRSRGCLPAEQFIPQLMDLAGEPYYFARRSATERRTSGRRSSRSLSAGTAQQSSAGRCASSSSRAMTSSECW